MWERQNTSERELAGPPPLAVQGAQQMCALCASTADAVTPRWTSLHTRTYICIILYICGWYWLLFLPE
jgi:hypothetical protein